MPKDDPGQRATADMKYGLFFLRYRNAKHELRTKGSAQ